MPSATVSGSTEWLAPSAPALPDRHTRDARRAARRDEAWFLVRAVIGVALSVSAGEALMMCVLNARWFEVSRAGEATIDAAVMAAATIPTVALMVIRPMRRRISAQLESLELTMDRLA